MRRMQGEKVICINNFLKIVHQLYRFFGLFLAFYMIIIIL